MALSMSQSDLSDKQAHHTELPTIINDSDPPSRDGTFSSPLSSALPTDAPTSEALIPADSSSPRLPLTSPSVLRAGLPVIQQRPPTKTYGAARRAAAAAAAVESDALPPPPSPSFTKAHSIIARDSSLIIPESDPLPDEAPLELSPEAGAEMEMQMEEEDAAELGNLESDPEDAPRREQVAPKSDALEDGNLSSSDDDDDNDEGDTTFTKESLFQRKSVAEMLAEQEERERLEDEAEELAHRAATAAAAAAGSSEPLVVPSTPSSPPRLTKAVISPASSSSPHVTGAALIQSPITSEADPVRRAEDHTALRKQRDPESRVLTSLAPSHHNSPQLSSNNDVDEEDAEEIVSTHARKLLRRGRVQDSDDDDESAEDEGDNLPASAATRPLQRLPPPPSLSTAPTTAADRHSKLSKLLKKRAPTATLPDDAVGLELSEEDSIDDSDSDGGRRGKKGKGKTADKSRRTKGQSKKDEEAMNRETEAIKRQQSVRIVPRSKHNLQADPKRIAAMERKEVKPQTFRPGRSTHGIHLPTPATQSNVIPETPSDGIENSSPALAFSYKRQPSSPAPPPTLQRRVVLPPPSRALAPPRSAAAAITEDDDDEDLPMNLSVGLAQINRETERKALAEALRLKKLQAIAAASAKRNQSDDSDDDLAIEGAPGGFSKPSSVPKAARPTPRSALSDATKTPRMSKNERTFNAVAGPSAHAHDHNEDLTASQFETAGRTYGQGWSAAHRETLQGNKKAQRPAAAPAQPTAESLMLMLKERMAEQNFQLRLKKETKFRIKKAEQATLARQQDVEAVDVAGVLKTKAAKLKEAQERGEDLDEEEADGSWVGSDEDEAMQYGSGSDFAGSDEEPSNEDLEEEAGSGSEPEEPVKGRAMAGALDDEDEDDGSMPAPAGNRSTRRVVDDEDEEGQESLNNSFAASFDSPGIDKSAPVPVHRMDFFGMAAADTQLFGFDDDGGLSQFAAGTVESPSASDKFAHPAATFGQFKVDDAELEDDMAEMEACAEQTPRQRPAAPQRFLNQHGLFTQTRPQTAFFASPLDSPRDSQSPFSHPTSVATTKERSQITQTQIEPETPTQAARDGRRLVRANALVPFGSVEVPATGTQPDSTEVLTTLGESNESTSDEAPVDVDGESQMTELTSGQPAPPRLNAFEALANGARHAAAPPLAAPPKVRKGNQFIDAEVEMSDEEVGFGGDHSGDEDETGLDMDDEELVDREAVDEEKDAEENELVHKLHAEKLAEDDAALQARMKGVADGKERRKRKNGGLDFSDDDFDDDNYGISRSKKSKRPKNATMEELEGNEETQAFARPLKDGLGVSLKEGECSFLLPLEADADEDAEEDDYEEDEQDEAEAHAAERISALRAERRLGESRVRMSYREERRLIVEQTLRAQERSNRSPSPRLHTGISSSPDKYSAQVKIVTRTAKVTESMRSTEESQFFLTSKYAAESRWKADSKEDSQGNGLTAGSRSAVAKRYNHHKAALMANAAAKESAPACETALMALQDDVELSALAAADAIVEDELEDVDAAPLGQVPAIPVDVWEDTS